MRALGGHAEKILHDIDTGISFNRAGNRFAFIRFVLSKDVQTSQFMTAQPDGSDPRIVASLKGDGVQLETCTPMWGPDDDRILAVFFAAGALQLGTIDAATGERHLIPQPWRAINAVAWSGRSILLSGQPVPNSGKGWSGRGPMGLWSVDPRTGDQQPLTRDFNTYLGLSAAGDRQTVVTVRTEPEAQIWVADRTGMRQITSGDFLDGIHGVSWLKEDRLVFTSNRAEPGEVWTINPDGTALEKLGLGNYVRWPTLTPDGKYLFFSRSGSLWRSSADGANGLEMATLVSQNEPLVAARNGDSVHYWGGRTGANGEVVDGVYRAPVLGGTPTLVRRERLEMYDVLTDGRLLGAMLVPQIKGGPGEVRLAAVLLEPAQGKVQVLEGIPLIKPPLAPERYSIPMLIGPSENEILYVDVVGETPNVWQHSLLDGRRRQLTNFTTGTILGFSRSAGGRLAISHGRIKHDVVRVALAGDK